MPTARLDGEKISNWPAFHDECKEAFGFPDFYGRNMDAWIDCMSTLREEDGMTRFRMRADETLEIQVLHSDSLRRKTPDILRALGECASVVNDDCIENGEKPALALVLL
jgi:hypothetical protein